MHKTLGVMILIIIAAVLACGCTSSSGASPSASPAAAPSGEVQIIVSYDGAWSGAYGDLSGQSSIDGTGDRTITLDGSKMVSCSFQKRDAGTGTLSVKIMKGSTVLKESSTSAQYGVVTCAASV